MQSLMALQVNMQRDPKKHPKAAVASDFAIVCKEPQSISDQKATLKLITCALGGTVKNA